MRYLIGIIVAAVAIALPFYWAFAHGSYSQQHDPVYATNCCGGSDCAPLPADWIAEKAGGYQVTLTLTQAQAVNPNAKAGLDAFVPYARIIPSWDGDFHLCIFSADRGPPRKGVICLIVPLAT